MVHPQLLIMHLHIDGRILIGLVDYLVIIHQNVQNGLVPNVLLIVLVELFIGMDGIIVALERLMILMIQVEMVP
jgi:hypothetical protein